MSSDPTVPQQAALQCLIEAQRHLFTARGHLLGIHPVVQESTVYRELLKLEEKLSEAVQQVGKLKLS